MPTVSETNQILDYIAENPQDQRSFAALKKFGLQQNAVDAWKAAKENPLDPKSIAVKNKVFDTIALNLPAKQEVNDTVGFVDRFKVKNLIDRDPVLQQKYFSQKGYDARVRDGQVEIRQPGDPQYTAVDPEGIDRFDVFDIFGDALEAVVTAAGSSTKFLGAVGAPVTGGASLAAASGASGALSAGFETGKQAIAKGMGLREEYDPNRIAQQFLIGAAAPVVAKGAEKAFSKLAQFTAEHAPKLREGWQEIMAAGKKMNIIPALRQKYDDKMITFLEEGAEKTPTFFAGKGIQKQAAERTKAYDEVADKIVGKYSAMDYVGLGEKAKKLLVGKVSKILEPIEKSYDKIDTYLKGQTEHLNIDDTVEAISKNLDEWGLDDGTNAALNKVYNKLSSINSILDIKRLRTIVGKDASMAFKNGDTIMGNALDNVYDALTKSRNASLTETIKEAETAIGADTAEAAIQALGSIDKQYAQVSNLVKNIFLQRGETTKLGVRKIVENFDEVVKESDVFKKILDTSDPKKLEYLRKAMPDAFAALRDGYLAKTAQQTTSGLTGQPSLNVFLNKIVKLPKQTQQIMFGKEYLDTIKNLQTLAATMPKPLNPSGTAWTQGGFKEYFTREFAALGRSAQLNVLRSMPKLSNFMNQVSSQFAETQGRAAVEFGLRESLPGNQETEKNKNIDPKFGMPRATFTAPAAKFELPGRQ